MVLEAPATTRKRKKMCCAGGAWWWCVGGAAPAAALRGWALRLVAAGITTKRSSRRPVLQSARNPPSPHQPPLWMFCHRSGVCPAALPTCRNSTTGKRAQQQRACRRPIPRPSHHQHDLFAAAPARRLRGPGQLSLSSAGGWQSRHRSLPPPPPATAPPPSTSSHQESPQGFLIHPQAPMLCHPQRYR